jgi:hypothetical protein
MQNAQMHESKNARMHGQCTIVARLIVAAALLGALGPPAARAAAQQVTSPQQTPLQRLQASIERTTRSVNATWGIYVKSIDTGDEIALDADRQMETMSTIKIPLMVEAFEQIKARKFALTDKYAGGAGQDHHRVHFHRQPFRIRRGARERDRPGGQGRRGLLRVPAMNTTGHCDFWYA